MTAGDEHRDMREAVVQELIRSVDEGSDVVVLVSDSTSTSGIAPFAARFPGRLLNVGIAEQNLLGIAAGLSLGGQIPVTANAASFLVSRSNEQLKIDICYSRTNVKLLGLNAGVAYGSLAATHHAINDIAVMRSLGEILIFAPADAVEAAQMIRYALAYDGPVYVRLDNARLPVYHAPEHRFRPGAIDVLAQGRDVTIFALGSVVQEAMKSRESLMQRGIDASVANVSSIRPVERQEIARLAARSKAVVTVEEHSMNGGMGSLVCEVLAEQGLRAHVERIGIPEGEFAKAGPRSEIRKHYGMDAAGIEKAVMRILASRS